MNLKVIEPLNLLFKDEVRKVGKSLDIPNSILDRHPFPGPGLGIRILGEIDEEKVKLLQEADDIFISSLRYKNLLVLWVMKEHMNIQLFFEQLQV